MRDDNQNKTLSIIIPCFNEERTLRKITDLIKKAPTPGLKKEIIVVDDGSTDGTVDILSYLANNGLKVIRLNANSGKGNAIREGIKHATGEITIIQDADLEYDPNDYQKLVEPILSGESQVVYGSRILNKKNAKGADPISYLGGLFLTRLANLLYRTRITDVCTCYKVFETSILQNIDLKCYRFDFCQEVTAKIAKKGIKISERPISYNPRTITDGKKIKWRDGIEAIWTLIRYRITK